jgi:hypothetical protein
MKNNAQSFYSSLVSNVFFLKNKSEKLFFQLFVLKVIKVFFLLSLFMFSTAALADVKKTAGGAGALNEGNISFENHLKEGYILIKIPIYDDDGRDKGINPDKPGYIKIDGSKHVKFWSFSSAGHPQGNADWYWVRAYGYAGTKRVEFENTRTTTYWKKIYEYGNERQINMYKSGSVTYARVKLYIPNDKLEKEISVNVSFHVDVNNGSDAGEVTKTQNFSPSSFPTPTLSQDFSADPGYYDLGFSISQANDFSKYEYSLDNVNFTEFSGTSGTVEVETTSQEQTKNVYIKYTLSDYDQYVIKSEKIKLPAYQWPRGFEAKNRLNGNTKLSWSVNKTNLGDSPIDGDDFEIQRADNSGFNNAVSIATIPFTDAESYNYIDETSEENLNGEYFYRIRRTKTAAQWNWEVAKTASVVKAMAHKYIESATARLSKKNIARITWKYDNGNVWTNGASVRIERYNQTNGAAKETIIVPEDSLANQSYSEELFLMCNKFNYRVYVKPGNTNYSTQDAVSADGDDITPVETGNILSLKASKGYFSDRTELSWETDGLPIDFFAIKSRIYKSGNDFKQIDQVQGSDGSKLYQYNDEVCNPGQIYEYQIVGIVQCADKVVNTDTLYTFGFRTPTGDIYGRVTFDNGQAEEGVQVILESSDGVVGKSMLLATDKVATIDNNALLETNTDSITIQAWVSPNSVVGNQNIFTKPGMYELGISDDHIYFNAGTDNLSSSTTVSSYTTSSSFVHISAVKTSDSLFLYINGKLKDSLKSESGILGNTNQIVLGGNYSGAIDEIRLWNKALTSADILRDYNRYITGGEKGLIAYWKFNYSTSKEFYDLSYNGSNYNENHGHFNGASLSETQIPSNEQLGFKGVTATDGSYAIRAIPYIGNGTVYTIIPRKGIHTFESQKEVRFIGVGSQSHTVNFTDKSSFKVSGTVTYKGGTLPVEGVSFTVDGIVAMGSNGSVLLTDSKGEFEIQVPVGSHEVVAVKRNHIFENDGKITDSKGQDRNYQDEVLGIELKDITTIKYIGRVAGGVIQDNYPLGHSLSKNNLADGVEVILTSKRIGYEISSSTKTETVEHFLPSNKHGDGWPKTNDVEYGKSTIKIYPNAETGEFVAYVIPETYVVKVSVPGHDDIPGSGEDIDFTQKFRAETEIHEYVDSTLADGVWTKTNYSDTVFYNASSKFIKRYSPTVRISQVDKRNNVLPYYGDTIYTVRTLGSKARDVQLYSEGKYLLGKPVFEQSKDYKLKAEVFEKYTYYTQEAKPKEGIPDDEVPTQDAQIEFSNNLAKVKSSNVEADEKGIAFYSFKVTDPELTSAMRAISAKVYYGDQGTSINWDGAFDGIILGSVQLGRDFVTGGPEKVLMVLRDPPGSNSYSYLEKGVTVEESSSYIGSLTNEGSETFTQNLGLEVVTFAGLGAGVITSTEVNNGFSIGVLHQETVGGTDTKESVTTTTTRFQTSDSPDFVGADGDVFVGYSTNISYGSTECVNIISKNQYDNDPSKYTVYTAITPVETNDFLLVKQTGLGVAQSFGTLFAYPQSHIVDRMLPEMKALRNYLLMQEGSVPDATLQALANENDTTFYVSHLSADDPNYGKSNIDKAFDNVADPDPDDDFNGPSYKVIFPQRDDFTRSDTILYLNQSIDNWYSQLAANEKAKLDAKLMQNYSFHGGSPIEYTESYSSRESSTVNFSIMVGLNYNNEIGAKVSGSGFNLTIDESLQTEHGGEWTNATEIENSKGFVLSEDGNDYISVDVLRENAESSVSDSLVNDFYPTFIFRTKAGATSCPYEGAYVSRFYQAGQHTIDEVTKKIEVPEIAVENDFIENVPSGNTASFTLYLRNNSEIKQDNWYTLKIVDESNPNGAKMLVDGAPIGNGRDFIVPAGETLTKTLEVGKGAVMNYDNLKLILQSQCQDDIVDTLSFSVHFTPSCSEVNLAKPTNNWTYNTKNPVLLIDGVEKHYMDIVLDGFDINYDSFDHISLQYKTSAQSDDEWVTLMKYYSDSTLYEAALEKGNAEFINPSDAGSIKYAFKMDDLPDQRYDIRAVSVCMINNDAVENATETSSGIKDMLCPRLFGSAQPANGILTIDDEIRLNFNEQIAEGYLTKNNFQVTGIRNGTKTDHSVSVNLDGENDFMQTEFEKNMSAKDMTVEMWIKSDEAQDATLFSQGNINESIEMALTSNNHLKLNVGGDEIISQDAVPFEAGSWAHIAFVYDKSGYISAYYNFEELISQIKVQPYGGIGNFVLGRSIHSGANFFKGNMQNVRIWDKEKSSGQLQTNSLAKLSGNEQGLMAYYPMNEAKGTRALDKARGANMIMNGCNWSYPDGRSVEFNGTDSYLKLTTGSSAVIDESMDYTLEFWFKGDAAQTNATLLANGRGDGKDLGGSNNLFSIGFDGNGDLTFANNGLTTNVDGDYLDSDWHHFALTVNRVIGRAQIYIDGDLKKYFDAESLQGIASAYMYVGARAWYAVGDASTLITDNYFKGKIDELRIWDSYKSKDLIQNNNNIKLDGEEMGLLAYYPFEYFKEWQGTKELNFTLADMKIQPNPESTVPDAVSTAATESTDIPPVKNKGPVSNLEFDFVVNNDALIINLKESWAKIEKTIITFTADGIRDMNGNENVSPISWSAYIDRNQLKWSQSDMDISKAVNEPLEFSLQAINSGGTVQDYKIENMPSWMIISPSSGTIDPSSSVDIQFEINEGLNIGSYNEVIYLTNEDNVSEALDVSVTVNGESPDWSVNPADFKYNMSVFGKMRFNNIFSSDSRDKVAAFHNGQCIGLTTSSYDRNLDMWYALLSVYSNETQFGNIEFRMWDASTGKTYLADAGIPIDFVNNSVIGTPDDPVIFDGKEMLFQNITLNPGWNWISFNVNTHALSDLNSALANMNWSSNDFFKSEADNVSANYSILDSTWKVEKSLSLNNSLMYKLSSSVLQTLSLAGTAILPSTLPISIEANKWNYISYLPSVRLTTDEALAGYDAQAEDVIKSQTSFAMYAQNMGWVGSLSYLEPGQGYMMKRNSSSNTHFVYPNTNGSLSTKNSVLTSSNPYVDTHYSGNMSLVAVSDIQPQMNDRILTYVGDKLNSEISVQNVKGEYLYFITVSGDDNNSPASFELVRNGEVIGISEQFIPYSDNSVNGTVSNPLKLKFRKEEQNISIYPNPIKDKLTVSFLSTHSKVAELKVLDVMGREMINTMASASTNGLSRTVLDCSQLKPGVYLLYIIKDGTTTIRKIEKQ